MRVTDKSQIVHGKWITFCCEIELEEITPDNLQEYLDYFDNGKLDPEWWDWYPLMIWDTEQDALSTLKARKIQVAV